MKNKKLVIVTTDGEIELAILVDATRLSITEYAVQEAKKIYYTDELSQRECLFDDVLFSILREKGVDYEYVEPYEIS